MFNYNFGGIKGTGPSGLSVSQRTKEGWGASERTITDNFRAYQTAEEGATDYLKLLARRYPRAIEAARTGDSQDFVHQLKVRGYFTGNEDVYARSVASLANDAMRAIGAEGSVLASPPALGVQRIDGGSAGLRLLATDATRRATLDNGLTATSLMSLHDELTRAALRIAATGPQRRDRDT